MIDDEDVRVAYNFYQPDTQIYQVTVDLRLLDLWLRRMINDDSEVNWEFLKIGIKTDGLWHFRRFPFDLGVIPPRGAMFIMEQEGFSPSDECGVVFVETHPQPRGNEIVMLRTSSLMEGYINRSDVLCNLNGRYFPRAFGHQWQGPVTFFFCKKV